MPIDPSISDMPWLTQSADPIGSLLKGASAGAQIARTRLEQAGLAQRVQEFQANQEIRQQQLAMELAQAPLKQTLLQQDAQMNALKIEQGLRAKQDDIEADKAFTGLQGAIFDKLNSGNLDAAVLEYAKGASQNPSLLVTDKYKALGSRLEAMQKEADLVKSRAAMAAARMEAAKGSELRSLPPDAKFQRLLQNAQANLQDELDQENPDPALVEQYKKDVIFYQGRLQLAHDKLATEQSRIAAENRRTNATERRTQLSTVEQLEAKSLQKRIDKINEQLDDETMFPSQVSSHWWGGEKVPNPKRTELEKKRDSLEKQKAALGVAPVAPPTAAAGVPTPPASVPPTGERIQVIDRDQSRPTYGKKFWIDAVDQERAARQGYEMIESQ